MTTTTLSHAERVSELCHAVSCIVLKDVIYAERNAAVVYAVVEPLTVNPSHAIQRLYAKMIELDTPLYSISYGAMLGEPCEQLRFEAVSK